jgi:hypothetical protein
MADAPDLGSGARKGVGVRLSPLAPLSDLRIFARRPSDGDPGNAVLPTPAHGTEAVAAPTTGSW